MKLPWVVVANPKGSPDLKFITRPYLKRINIKYDFIIALTKINLQVCFKLSKKFVRKIIIIT